MDVTMMLSTIFRSRSAYDQLFTTLGAPEHVPNTYFPRFSAYLKRGSGKNMTTYEYDSPDLQTSCFFLPC